ncbi:CRISPR-associated endonuclease/helicase Cas3 [Gammaproteobacteria bacterium]
MSEDAIYRYWGKAGKSERFHLLSYHCLDVAAIAAQWWAQSPSLRRALCHVTAVGEEATRAWVLFFIALHDFGKLDIRFQLKAPHALAILQPDFDDGMAELERDYSHGLAGHYWFKKDMAALGFTDRQWDRWRPWVEAVAGHHGDLNPNKRMGGPDADEEVIAADRNARRAWLKSLATLFLAPVGLSLNELPPPCPELVAGLCSVSDWLGSSEAYFPYQIDPIPLADYWEQTRQNAALAFAESGLFQPSLKRGGMGQVFPDLQPRQLQTLVDCLPVSPGLILIEAPTGSGKTEAALAYASRLLTVGLADGVIFALPTQATANAMFERLERIAGRMFPSGANLLLAHGKANYNRNFQALKTAQRPTVQDAEEAMVQCVAWLGASRKRALLGQIGVCTIDQVLLSVLPVRHQFVRAFGVRKAILIVDEVHAYDAYMVGLLRRVLEGQSRAGGCAILLSATLPSYQKAALCRSWNPRAELAQANPYPLVTHLGKGEKAQTFELSEEQLPLPRTVELDRWYAADLLPDEVQCRAIIAAAQSGVLVGIVCNLVDNAQRLAERLRGMADGVVPIDLFHARYRFKDRLTRENAVIAHYGKEALRGAGRILVATQVIEQSLDLDFDWLITQLCPVDLLFQRLGRLHRHDRNDRPTEFKTTRCTLLLPSAESDEMPDYGLHGVVYKYKRVLWRTQQWVERHPSVEFPTAYREWIETVYDESPWPQESEKITKDAETHLKEMTAAFFAALGLASSNANPLPDTDGNAAKLTRDGEMSLSVVLILQAKSKTLLDGRRLNSIDEAERDEVLDLNTVHVPAGWRKRLPEADAESRHWLAMQAAGDNRWQGQHGTNLFLYDRDAGLRLATEE